MTSCPEKTNKASTLGHSFDWGSKTYIMGILNVTPDSFSGDGFDDDKTLALQRAQQIEAEGADIIDVGGESTRPGSTPITAEEEKARVVPIIELMAPRLNIPISVDTYKFAVAQQSLEAGASIINDVWGLKNDPSLAQLAAATASPIIIMHNQVNAKYSDLMGNLISSLESSLNIALSAGVLMANVIVDPGLGFGKTHAQNLEILTRLRELKSLGLPIVVGTSRKSTIGTVLGLPVEERLEGTSATVAIAIANGADMVRVHDIKEMVRVARMSDAIVRGWQEPKINASILSTKEIPK